MKKQNFLIKLRKEGKLDLIEPSEEIKVSYLRKAENCLRAAKILHQNKLYENSTSEAYYCMYNSLLALLFKAGIKSENHAASIILLKKLFNEDSLYQTISFAKEERIDKQYYVETQQREAASEESCNAMCLEAEELLLRIKLLISQLNNERLLSIRASFETLF